MSCSRKRYRRHHTTENGFHRPRRRRGFIRRVIHTLGQRFGIKPKWILVGFIIGFVFQPFVALGLFLISWFWIDNPGKLEGWWAQAKNMFGAGMAHATAAAGATTNAGPAQPSSTFSDSDIEVDVFMDDLKRQFDDLERRTNGMESHITSDEYALRQEFKKMDDKKDTE